MCSELTAGLPTVDCKDNVGGIRTLYLANKDNVTAVTATSGNITAITMSASTKFYKFKLPKFTGSYTETEKGNTENGTVMHEQVVNIALRKMDVTKRNLIKTIATADMVGIVEDNNGTLWYIGETNGIDLTENVAATGTSLEDKNGYNLSFLGKEKDPAQTVTAGIIAALIA